MCRAHGYLRKHPVYRQEPRLNFMQTTFCQQTGPPTRADKPSFATEFRKRCFFRYVFNKHQTDIRRLVLIIDLEKAEFHFFARVHHGSNERTSEKNIREGHCSLSLLPSSLLPILHALATRNEFFKPL